MHRGFRSPQPICNLLNSRHSFIWMGQRAAPTALRMWLRVTTFLCRASELGTQTHSPYGSEVSLWEMLINSTVHAQGIWDATIWDATILEHMNCLFDFFWSSHQWFAFFLRLSRIAIYLAHLLFFWAVRCPKSCMQQLHRRGNSPKLFLVPMVSLEMLWMCRTVSSGSNICYSMCASQLWEFQNLCSDLSCRNNKKNGVGLKTYPFFCF